MYTCNAIAMKNPAVFGFYGESDAGKTSLIVKVIKKLNDDRYNVATVKITDKKIVMDVEGKDTWKYSQAGSKLAVLSSPVETDFIIKERKDIDEILQIVGGFGCYDIVLIEGVNDKNIPKIRLRDMQERENTIISYDGDFDGLIETIKKEITKKEHESEGKVSIKVNGKQIPLTEFPSQFIKNTIIGMLKSLKGVDEKIKDVEIKF